MADNQEPKTEQPMNGAEAAINPGWDVGVMTIGQIKLPMVILRHPRHGPLSMLVPIEVARHVAALLNDAAATAEASLPPRTAH